MTVFPIISHNAVRDLSGPRAHRQAAEVPRNPTSGEDPEVYAGLSQPAVCPGGTDVPAILDDKPGKQVIYAADVRSMLAPGDDGQPDSVEVVESSLDTIVALGATALELVPTVDFDGIRDWRHTDFGRGFTMPVERARAEGLVAKDSHHGSDEKVRIDEPEAFTWFLNRAHQKGLIVQSELGSHHSSAWPREDSPGIGGKNSELFGWGREQFKETPWGPVPDFNQDSVKGFILGP